MKPSAFLINTARGGLVDEAALATALREGKVAGAGLDVFHDEPLHQNPFHGLDNVVLSPHLAAYSREGLRETGVLAALGVVAVLEGRRPDAAMLVNPAVYQCALSHGERAQRPCSSPQVIALPALVVVPFQRDVQQLL